ncbi:cytochrome P450 [Oryctes borbonicus]|uniref:Cytochrome P450 n=1 Tax=Oryctes borbonicus TaxID=1629725 RepID=A0A0T6AW38_9SCAR|nr:cytochrome P450 [Oryctes borbonicus]
MVRRFKQYAGIFRSWIGTTPNINLSKPEYAEIILNNSIHIDKSPAYDYMKPWLGEGLLTSTGRKWQSRRKMLTPAFHFKILDDSLRIFDMKARTFIDQLNKIPAAEVFDMYPYITHCTLDIICETAMGVQLDSMNEQNNEYVDAIYTVTDIALQRIIKPWYQPSIIFNLTEKGRRFHQSVGVLHDFTSRGTKTHTQQSGAR